MTKRREAKSRSDVSGQVEHRKSELDEKGEQITRDADDVELERKTLEELDLIGTSDAAEAVEQAVEEAQENSAREFDEHEHELGEAQEETEQVEQDLRERSDANATDAQKLADAEGRMHGDAATSRLEKAEREATQDAEFLEDQRHRAQEARQESRRINDEQRDRVRTARRL